MFAEIYVALLMCTLCINLRFTSIITKSFALHFNLWLHSTKCRNPGEKTRRIEGRIFHTHFWVFNRMRHIQPDIDPDYIDNSHNTSYCIVRTLNFGDKNSPGHSSSSQDII